MKYNIISKEIVHASEHFRINYTLIVEYCVQLRKKAKHTAYKLAKKMNIRRQKLSDFENLKILDYALASNIMEYYNEQLSISRKHRNI